GRRVREILRGTDVNVVAHDPYLSQEDADRLGIRPVKLDELFASSDVISLHAPNLPSTRRMIGARQFRLMKEGAVFINTARGALIDEQGMIEALEERSDIW